MDELFYKRLEDWIFSDFYYESKKTAKNCIKIDLAFKKKYPLAKLKNMTKEQYVFGDDGFPCFINEIEKCTGSIGGIQRPQQIYGLAAKNGAIILDTRRTKKFGLSEDVYFDNIRNCILDAIEAIESKDYLRLDKNDLCSQFKSKLDYLYGDTYNQIPIYSDEHLMILLDILDISYTKNESVSSKRRKLYCFYKNDSFLSNQISTILFSFFIYSGFGYYSYLKGKKRMLFKQQKSLGYSFVKVGNQIPIDRKNKIGNYNDSPESELNKKIIGRKGEEAVLDFLNKNKKAFDIKEISNWCFGENRNDSKGYDFSYIKNDGIEMFVEVKSSVINHGNTVRFEMSRNEYEVLKKHRNNYLIFILDDINSDKNIQILKASDLLYEPEPTKYLYHFEKQK